MLVMDILLIVIGSIFIIIGIIGCFLPILPGPPISWLGIFTIFFIDSSNISTSFLVWWLVISVIVTILDYFIPIWGTKKFGGTKMGMRGSMAGLVIGLFFPPFLGALLAELINDVDDTQKALKSAFGSFLGFILSTGIKFGVSLSLAWYFIADVISMY